MNQGSYQTIDTSNSNHFLGLSKKLNSIIKHEKVEKYIDYVYQFDKQIDIPSPCTLYTSNSNPFLGLSKKLNSIIKHEKVEKYIDYVSHITFDKNNWDEQWLC